MWCSAKCFALVGLLAAGRWFGTVGTCEAQQPPQMGDVAPEFICLDDQGSAWDSRDHVGRSFVVVYFYLSDFAFCCTRQAQRYRDAECELDDLGAEVVGISGDAVEAHRLFKDAHQLKHVLLADTDGHIARQFGVPLRAGGKAMVKGSSGEAILDMNRKALFYPRNATAERWTFILDGNGRIVYREMNVSSAEDTRQVLEFLRQQKRLTALKAPAGVAVPDRKSQ